MSSDWKSTIDKYYSEDEEKRKNDAAEIRKKQDERVLAQHKGKFRCHVCKEPSSGPQKPEYALQSGDIKPSGLTKCALCDKWTCDNCLHRGICKECVKDLPWITKIKRGLGMKWLPKEKEMK